MARHGEDAKILAGGHSLLPAMKLRLASPRYLIDIGQLPDMRGIKIDGATLVIGALTVHADILSSQIVRQRVPGLSDAASVIGDVQVRNRGTIGGSVAHADPAADFPVMLAALNASVVLQSLSGSRSVPADEFFIDFFTTAMAQNELVTEIRVPLPSDGTGTAYAKLAHPASGYVVVSAGALVVRQQSGSCVSSRIAIGGLGSGPTRAIATEIELQGKPLTPQLIGTAAAKAAEEADIDDDPYASADYKRHMATVLARRAIESAVERSQKG
jgi:carbon-monoxide dehydrogenase medium subunit